MTTAKECKKTERRAPAPKVHSDQFIALWGFMRADLGLDKTELLVYAVIFSMYWHRGDYFCGSREYLESWSGAGKTAVSNALLSLEKKNLIIKEYRRFGNATKAIYTVNTDSLPTHEMFKNENRNRDINEKIKRAEKMREYGLL